MKRSKKMQKAYDDYLKLGKEPFSENEIVREGDDYTLYVNMFPYDLVADDHLILVLYGDKILDSHFIILKDYIERGYHVFMNPISYQSVPTYTHVHIIKYKD